VFIFNRSRHTVVCHAVQENRAHVSIFAGATTSQFTCICSSVMSDLKGAGFPIEVPSTHGGQIPNLKKIPFPRYAQAIKLSKKFLYFFHSILLFSHFAKNCYNLHIRIPIRLKFETCIGGLKLNTNIKFGINLIKIEGVISDFTHKIEVELLSLLQDKLLRVTS